MEEQIQSNLTKNEALVLFGFLSRFSNQNNLNIEDQAEERVLWNLHCDLEKALVEPFKEDYDEILAKARVSLKDKIE